MINIEGILNEVNGKFESEIAKKKIITKTNADSEKRKIAYDEMMSLTVLQWDVINIFKKYGVDVRL